MTDEHGSESQPVHDDASAEGHPSHEAEAGVWSDDHPPVDDFADTASAGEEVATASQEAAADGEETASSSVATSSRSMLPLFAGIGGVLLIGAVVYWQFGHSSPPPPVMPASASAPKMASAISAKSDTQASPTTAAASATGQNADIASLYKQPTEVPPPMPGENMPSSMLAAPMPSAQPSQPLPSALPSVSPTATAALPATLSPAVEARIDTISTRIDNLQKSLTDATRQLNQLSNMVAATQAMPPSSGQANPVLEDRLNKIEQSLMQVEHNETKTLPVSKPVEIAETPAATVIKTVSHHARSPARHKTVHRKMVTHKSPPAPNVVKASSAPAPWVLRAATPSEAWVSTSATSSELRHVQIGDFLTGVGEIRAIRQTASGWEIDGSAGTVR